MRVMTWNILDGGGATTDSVRLTRVIEVIRAETPDVLVLQEANEFDRDQHRLLHQIEGAVGMRGFLAPAPTGYHIAAFARPPLAVVRSVVEHRGFHHVLFQMQVKNVTGDVVNVVAVHLCPHSPDRRLLEVRNLIRHLGITKYELCLGDFNSLEPGVDHRGLLSRMPPAIRLRFSTLEMEPDTRVADALSLAGLVDLGATTEGDRTTAPTPLGLFGTAFGHFRIDYIYASPDLAANLTRFRVLKNEATASASDHYPLVADFVLGGERNA